MDALRVNLKRITLIKADHINRNLELDFNSFPNSGYENLHLMGCSGMLDQAVPCALLRRVV